MHKRKTKKIISYNKCVYCLSHEGITLDHLIPQTFYKEHRKGKRLSSNFYIKVPCCRDCNQKKSMFDNYIWALFTVITVDKEDEAKESFKRLQRAFSKDKRLFQQFINESNKPVNIKTKAGIFLEQRIAFNVDMGILLGYISQITKGLIWYHSGKYVQGDKKYTISVTSLNKFPIINYRNVFDKMKEKFGDKTDKVIYNRENDPIFRYVYLIESDRIQSLWALAFFSRLGFVIKVFKS